MPRDAKTTPTPRDQARQARMEVYRQHVLDAAEQVFAERGFEAAKLQDISKLAGLSMGTIYAVFPGKAEILAAILAERGREMHEVAQSVVARGSTPLDTLKQLSEAYIDYFIAHPAFLSLHLHEGTAWVQAPIAGVADRAANWSAIHELQTAIFRSGIEQGIFVDEDPGFLAKTFSALDQVVLADWAAGGMSGTREQLVSRLQGMVSRTFTPAAL